MSTFPFSMSPGRKFQFRPMLDGKLYTGYVTWNVAGRRLYLSIYGASNVLIFSRPFLGSPSLMPIDRATWNADSGLVTLVTSSPHGLPIGSVPQLSVVGVAPPGYNGLYEMAVQSPTSLSYPLTADPGGQALVGSVGRLFNMAAGYFDSAIIFQNGNILVTP